MNRRPRLTLVAPGASPEEAAAVVAAVEQFMRQTVPAPAPAAQESGWREAALREAVLRAPEPPQPWL